MCNNAFTGPNKKALPCQQAGGFTLLEVLLAALIAGIFLAVALRLLTEQWKWAERSKQFSELQYSVVTAGRTLVNAVRSARSVRSSAPAVLEVLPWPESGSSAWDSYYVADKDFDGIKDLYWEHLNVPNPLTSRITGLTCVEIQPGLWQITLQATWGDQAINWSATVRQITFAPGG